MVSKAIWTATSLKSQRNADCIFPLNPLLFGTVQQGDLRTLRQTLGLLYRREEAKIPTFVPSRSAIVWK